MFVYCFKRKKSLVAFITVVLLIVLLQYQFINFTTSTSYWSTHNRYVNRATLQTGKSKKTCDKPKTDVLFLKTHKTGSSTITNILNRYADKNDLKVLLPEGEKYYTFHWPNKFRLRSSVNYFEQPNMLANHARYSRKSTNLVFPRETTMYISILRHPVSQWESTFQYFGYPLILDIKQKKDPLDFFLNSPPTIETITKIASKYSPLYLIKNPSFFDFGVDYRQYDNLTFIRRALKSIDADFDLVLITEYFDESLTLLRRRLCWDIDDVVHFKMNERLDKNKRNVLSESQIQLIKTWNNADMILYNHFLEKFWREVKKEGEDFHNDVIELRRKRKYYFKLCIEKEAMVEAYSSVYVKGFQIKNDLTGDTKVICQRMLKNEIHYLDFFRTNREKNQQTGFSIQNLKYFLKKLMFMFSN